MTSAASRRVLKDYVVGDTLGEGGFSKVKLGTHVSTGQKVALKLLEKKNLAKTDSTEMKQVQREIDALAVLSHKNIIKMFDVDWDCKYPQKNGKFKEILLLIIELAEGGELFDILSLTGAFSESVARTYFHQLISALRQCHSKGIAHRDLKPENLLLDGKFQLKVADFGFAHMRTGEGAHTMATECGTRGYMAPEILQRKPYNESADVFSAGVILFIMLAGFPPFQYAMKSDWWFEKIMSGRHSLFWKAHCRTAYFSESAKDFLNKILSADPSKRITLDQILEHEWFKGPILSEEELQEEMKARKMVVTLEKSKEKEAKEKKNQGVAVDAGSWADDPDRGIDDIPLTPPMFSGKMDARATSGDEDLEEFSSVSIEVPVFEEMSVFPCSTRFTMLGSPLHTLDYLKRLLGSARCKHLIDATRARIKATYIDPKTGSQVHFTIVLFSDPGSTERTIVELRRRKGDTLQFHALYDEILVQTGEMLYIPV